MMQGGTASVKPVTRKRSGFTIVELLIVIVIIAVLASITVGVFNGIQKRGRDSARRSDIAAVIKALELFYIDNGYYPRIRNSGSTVRVGEWSTSADASWETVNTETAPYFNSLKGALVPKYISKLPRDPINTQGTDSAASTSAYNYAYFGSYNSGYCGAPDGQMYFLYYRNEATGVTDTLSGNCPTTPLGPYGNGVSNVRFVK